MTDTATEGELAGDLGLATIARSLDADATRSDTAGAAGQPAGAPAPLEHDYTADAKELVDFAAELYFPIWPRLEQVWDQERRAKLVVRAAAVMKKWNFTMEAFLGKWGPEIMLAMSVGPAVLPTIQAIKADNADARKKAAEAERAAPPPDKSDAPPPKAAPAPADAAASSASSAAPPDELKLHKQA